MKKFLAFSLFLISAVFAMAQEQETSSDASELINSDVKMWLLVVFTVGTIWIAARTFRNKADM